jgi:uncharacterized protein
MKCPRCNNELRLSSIRELSLAHDAYSCSKCKGTWIGAEKLPDVEAKVENVFFEFRRIPSASEQMQILQCPECPGMVEMNKAQSQRDRKVIIDVCPKCHNIWLDGGEKKAIQQESLGALILESLRFAQKN